MTAPETSTREAAGAQVDVEPTATDEPTATTEPEFFDSLFRKRKKNGNGRSWKRLTWEF